MVAAGWSLALADVDGSSGARGWSHRFALARDPVSEQTEPYRQVRQPDESLFAEVGAATGACLLQFTQDDHGAFRQCALLAHGLLRLRCSDCGHDKRVVCSRKRQGIRPACDSCRMAQAVARAVDIVIPFGRCAGAQVGRGLPTSTTDLAQSATTQMARVANAMQCRRVLARMELAHLTTHFVGIDCGWEAVI